MASITQKINSVNGGISQQPDELKVPGQVVSAKNVFPDVTHGLQKRPGSKLIDSLSNGTKNSYTTGKWFSYYRDETEQYIGQVIRRKESNGSSHADDGLIRMWRCSDGQEMDVNGNTGALTTYLIHGTDDDIQTLTLNDTTFINNRTKPTAMATTVEAVQPNQAFVELKQIKYASQYSLDIFNNTAAINRTTLTTATKLGINYTLGTSATNARTEGTCDSVGTELFTVNTSDATSYVSAVDKDGNNFTNRGTNLYFRITATGQPTTTGGATPSYVCRYTVKIDMLYGGEGWQTGDVITVQMSNAASATNYQVTVEESSTSSVSANLCLVRPSPTPFDGETAVTPDSILGLLKTEILDPANSVVDSSSTGFTVEEVGNGLYITRTDTTFNINTGVSELLNVLTSEVQDVADLPKQCKHGYVVKIRNSANDEDDYYVKFFANNNLSGEGVWEECAKPGRRIEIDKATMPIQLTRTSATAFTLSQVDYDNCAVGDTFTAPKPSFISTVAGVDEDTITEYRYINKMVFFRNRLVFLSDENVVMSRPGNFFNFWPKSAIAASAEDLIDLSCSSEYPAIVYDAIQVNTGLVLFTKNQQFMLTTDSDVLSPLTAKINALSTYNFNHKTNPISLGTTLAFLDNAGKFTRMFEMASVLREGEPVILEQSKVISKLFPKDINLVANSRENSFIVFAAKDGATLYGYRYFTSGEKRLMQSWITWELSGNIQYLCMLDDAIYAVVRENGVDVMQRFNLKLSSDSTESVTQNDETYKVYLDNISSVTTGANTYNSSTNKTVFTKPNGYTSSKQLAAYDIDTGDDIGQYTEVTVNGSNLEIIGDWSNQTFLIGYLYDMEIEFPKFYYTQQSGDKYVTDVQSNLVIHRVKFNFGPLGLYETTLKRVGKLDYNETFESTFADQYVEGDVAIAKEQEVTLPVYERNTNYTLTLKSSHPTPATLYSLAWEGDYSSRLYKRV
tara:strand:+ start:846 stop:3734 length:2889 start_codon:yes stop_codon:yes gene_type:complete